MMVDLPVCRFRSTYMNPDVIEKGAIVFFDRDDIETTGVATCCREIEQNDSP